MLKQVMRVLMVQIALVSVACADISWWRPREISQIGGYTDSYAVAINRYGKMISLFDERILGFFDAATLQWSFVEIDSSSQDEPFLKAYTGSSGYQFNIGKSSKSEVITLDDGGCGCALVTLQSGPHKGKVAAVMYAPEGWKEIEVLSTGLAQEATLARAYDGRMLAVWVNKEDGKLMSSYHNGDKWIREENISSYTSVALDYNQLGPQIIMSDLGDAAVVWKVQDKNNGEAGLLVAEYFDGIEERWKGEHIISAQPLEKKGRHFSINFQGDLFVVWDADEGISAAHMHLMKYMIARAGDDNKEDEPKEIASPWTLFQLAQGEDLNAPKVCLDRQGNAVAAWLDSYSGIRSAYFSIKTKTWEAHSSPVTTTTAYASSMQYDTTGKARLLWIGEGQALSEMIYSQWFDFSSKTWSASVALNGQDDNSLIDGVNTFALAKADYGVVVWYDFFKEKLFYALLRDGIEPGRNYRREGILYKKKAELAKRRAARRQRGY